MGSDDTQKSRSNIGQTYVALSRATSIEGLYFKRKIFKSDIIFDKKIYDFLK